MQDPGRAGRGAGVKRETLTLRASPPARAPNRGHGRGAGVKRETLARGRYSKADTTM